MNSAILSLIMNGVIIVLLGATIVFAVRLTRNLKAFRDSRGELEKLIAELSQQIDKANAAIAGMRIAAKDAGKSLQDKIDAARTMSDELQVMNQSGSKIAGRMERQISERPRPAASTSASMPAPMPASRKPPRPPEKPARAAPRPAPQRGGFDIRDPEMDGDENIRPSGIQSAAERELYDALQKRKRPRLAGPEDNR